MLLQFEAAKSEGEAQKISKQIEAVLYDEMPYIVLVTTPILEVYNDKLTLPYTSILDGIQGVNGLPTDTVVSQ